MWEWAMKRLIVCCDGTWNDIDNQSRETNVFRIAKAIHGSQDTGGVLQIVLYLRGIGTSGLKAEIWIEGATGLGVDDNIRSAYMFIAQNYIPGDEIFLFGFSRGAYTARSLVGFLNACGILKRQNLADLPNAWVYYRAEPPHSPDDFKAKYNTDCHADAKVNFLGVWETVGALGIPLDLLAASNEKQFAFHDTGPCKVVKHACHALAIDEHRHNFVPTFWTGPAPTGVEIEQVWFAGAHADVGGGYATRGLADIPLVWMAEMAQADGLVLDWSCLPEKERLDPLAPTHDSSSGLFRGDRLMPMYRQIAETPCQVSFYERLYAPADDNGKLLPTINEAIHPSVITRYGKQAAICSNDNDGICATTLYTPKNLVPLFNKSGKLKPRVSTVD
jgi:uncharacterized protein (DUF2235 family)